jgi:hypothetical protein
VYLYIDNFEVRKEVIVRPKDMQPYVDLGLAGTSTIPAAEQQAIKQKITAFLAPRAPVLIDGRKVVPVLDRVNFIRRTLRTTGVIDPPEDLPVVSATLGVIFYYPISGLPRKVTMKWDLFSDRIQRIPGATTDEAGGMPLIVTPDLPVMEWDNFLANPSRPGLVPVSQPAAATLPVPAPALGCALIALGLTIWLFRKRHPFRGPLWILAGVMVLAAILLWPLARVPLPLPHFLRPSLNNAQAGTVLAALLKNVYRSFDYRDERVIYDALAASVTGDLLTQTYLETHRALVLQNQGGARAKVQDVQMLKSETTTLSRGQGFAVRCAWIVRGAVGHWGHIHQRLNQYEAQVIEHTTSQWK